MELLSIPLKATPAATQLEETDASHTGWPFSASQKAQASVFATPQMFPACWQGNASALFRIYCRAQTIVESHSSQFLSAAYETAQLR